MQAIQDQMAGNHCFGCGPDNQQGLQLKSYRQADGTTTATFTPSTFHNAGPPHFLNGGIQATIIDCHGICTAMADAYIREGRAIGEGDLIWYATGHMEVSYLEPIPINNDVELIASVNSVKGKKTVVECQLLSAGKLCAKGMVLAIRVPPAWMEEGGD